MNGVDLSRFDQMALYHNAGHAAFKSMYETRYPAPQRPTLQRESIFVPVALCIMIIASVLVSGSRTVLEFGGGIVGVSAFVMLEGAIVTYAFFRTRLNFDDSRMESVRRLANRGLGLSFTVAVAANVHSVIRGAGIETPPVVTITILILVAISAPTLAFISGDIMALELMRNSYKARKLDETYQAALELWMNDLNAAWGREKSKNAYRIEFEPVQIISNGIPLESSGNLPAKSTLGHTKKPDATKRVKDYLAENPKALQQNPLEVAAFLEVGKSTVYAVFKEMKSSHE